MPGMNYEEEIKKIRAGYNEQIDVLKEENDNIRKRLEEITKNNNRFREEQRKLAEFYGASAFDMQIESETTINVQAQDENGNLLFDADGKPVAENVKYIVKEREELQTQLEKNENSIRRLELFRNDEISKLRKQEREEKATLRNRQSLFEQACKFFTYLDTATTKGYNINGLTEDEIIDLYMDFYNNKERPGYKKIWDETIERMKKEDREINWPKKEEEEKQEEEQYGPLEQQGPPAPAPVNNESEREEEEEMDQEQVEKTYEGKLDKFKQWAQNHGMLIRNVILGAATATAVGVGIAVTGAPVVGAVAGLAGLAAVNTVLPGLGTERLYNPREDKIRKTIDNVREFRRMVSFFYKNPNAEEYPSQKTKKAQEAPEEQTEQVNYYTDAYLLDPVLERIQQRNEQGRSRR